MRHAPFLLALAVSAFPASSTAQDTLSPDEIVARIQASGTTASVIREVLFTGCPQADERGRRVFEAIIAADIPLSALVELPSRWDWQYVECNYAPLEAWFERGLDQVLASGNPGAVRGFIWRLPVDTPPTPRMRESLWNAAASGSYGGEVADLIATEAVKTTDPAQRVSLTVEAIARRSVSLNWISHQAGYLVREYPSLYLPAIARAAGGMPDARLELVLTSLHSHLVAGRVSPTAQGLDAVRASVRTRENLAPHLRALGTTN